MVYKVIKRSLCRANHSERITLASVNCFFSIFRPTALLKSVFIFLLLNISVAGCDNRRAEILPHTISVADKATLLATIPADEKPTLQATGTAYHAPQATRLEYIFSEKGGGVVYTVEKSGLTHVVYNGVTGKQYKAVGEVVISSDGKRYAYGALVNNSWCMVVDGREGEFFNTVKYPTFSPDGRHFTYQAMKGESWFLIIDSMINSGTDKRYLRQTFSGDSSRIAYIDNIDDANRGRLIVSDLSFRQVHIVESGNVSHFTYNDDKTRGAAAITHDGKQSVIDFSFREPGDKKKGGVYDSVQNITFGPDGKTLAYLAQRDGKSFIVLNNTELSFPEGVLSAGLTIRPDLKGVGGIISLNNQAYLWQSLSGDEKNGKIYTEMESLVYTRHGNRYAYAATSSEGNWFIVANGKEGPVFDRVVSPKFSPDGRYIVYRARKDGRRFVVVADSNGTTIRQHPAYDQVFDVKFTDDGKSVAYGVKDGQSLVWKVEPL